MLALDPLPCSVAVGQDGHHGEEDCTESFPLTYQDSARKLEENVYYFGRTVETLLLRFGKVSVPCQTWGGRLSNFGVKEMEPASVKCFTSTHL